MLLEPTTGSGSVPSGALGGSVPSLAEFAGAPETTGLVALNAGARIVVDLCPGRGGWSKPFIAKGWRAIGFDIARVDYPGELVLQDVRTIDGRHLRGVDLIVASPPCEEFSRWRMPWTRAKNPPAPDLSIIHACFYIAQQAGAPLILENVREAQRWIGPAAAHWGPFYLWGDGVPALLPAVVYRSKESWSSRDRARRAEIPTPLADWVAELRGMTTAVKGT